MATSKPSSSSSVRDRVLAHLTGLVAADTRNPPRAGAGIDAVFALVRAALSTSFVVEEKDLGDGCRWLRATRGDASTSPLVNVHIDTVPRDEGWTRNPWTLGLVVVDGQERAVGLGACDIKGAVAAFLVAAEDTDGPAELLLTSDEEAGSSRCVRTFVEEQPVAGRLILVAEPRAAPPSLPTAASAPPSPASTASPATPPASALSSTAPSPKPSASAAEPSTSPASTTTASASTSAASKAARRPT